MRTVTRTIPHASRNDRIRLYPLADVHVGNIGCDENLLQSTIQEIKDNELAFWLGMGDYADFINLRDKRFSANDLAPWITVPALQDLSKAQRDFFLDHTLPIADKCLGLIEGNHEAVIRKWYERNIYYEISQALLEARKEKPKGWHLGYSSFIRLRLERGPGENRKGHFWTIDIFAHHGWGGGRLAGSKALKLERAMRYFDADLILLAHWHTMQKDDATVIGLNRSGRLRKRNRRGTVCGTFLDGYPADASTYAEVAGYPPRPTGCPIIEFYPSTETIKIIS